MVWWRRESPRTGLPHGPARCIWIPQIRGPEHPPTTSLQIQNLMLSFRSRPHRAGPILHYIFFPNTPQMHLDADRMTCDATTHLDGRPSAGDSQRPLQWRACAEKGNPFGQVCIRPFKKVEKAVCGGLTFSLSFFSSFIPFILHILLLSARIGLLYAAHLQQHTYARTTCS